MLPDFIDIKTIWVIMHLFGVAAGAGGAYMSDVMFMSSVKDGVFDKDEVRFLKLGSRMVWAGLALLIISGIGLFFTDPEKYMASSKFLTKMIIVTILTINGYIFHRVHIPRIVRHMNENFPSSDEFVRSYPLLLIAGAISMTSWTSALILGALKSVPYPVWMILGIYGLCVGGAITSSLLLKDKILPKMQYGAMAIIMLAFTFSIHLQPSSDVYQAQFIDTPPPIVNLAIGDIVQTSVSVAISDTPGVMAHSISQNASATGEITAGPVLIDGTPWWYVDFAIGPDGWVQEPQLTH